MKADDMVDALIQVFEMFSSWAKEPVTVFARDLRHAESIYAEWIETHHQDKPTRPLMIYPYGGSTLEGRRELAFACCAGDVGIGYWDELPWRWLVAPPALPPAGDLSRPTSAVNYYRVTAADGDELMVFAESIEEAVSYYVMWRLEAYGSVPEGIQVDRQSRWQLVLALAPLRDEMDAGVAGIAEWTADDGWHIVDPDDNSVVSDHMR